MDGKIKKVTGVINRRKWVTLEKKLDIIKSHESGKTYAKIARENGMNESSVRSILRKKEQYRQQAVTSASLMSKVTRQRSALLNTMERHLISWIEDCNQKRIQLTENAVQKKALALFDELKQKEGMKESKEKFAASRGWLYRFKDRVNLHNCIILTEKPPGDTKAAAEFCSKFEEIVQNGGYTHQQIFTVEETTFYWKKMPSQTFLAESEKLQGHKPSKDYLTLLLCGNASGDLKLKPLVVFHAETPSALRDCEKSCLPVIWRSNKRAWLNQEIFQDWFNNHFSPTLETYCQMQGIELNILLLLDSAPNHDISFLNENIRVLFMPLNVSPVLQPMGQGIFSYLEIFYLRQIFSQAIEASSSFENFCLKDFWKSYNIRNAISNISAAWNEISVSDLSSSWHKLLQDIKPKDFEIQIETVAHDIVAMGKFFGLQTLDVLDVQNCFKSVISNVNCSSDNVDMEEQIIFKKEIPDSGEEEEEEEDEDFQKTEDSQKELLIQDLEKILEGVDKACETILIADPDTERSIKVRQILQNGIYYYRNLYIEKRKYEMESIT